MSMLISALRNPTLIVGMYVALLILTSLTFYRHRRRIFLLGLINHGGLFGLAALLAMPFYSPFPLDSIRWLSGLFIEMYCAAVFLFSGFRIIRFLRTAARRLSDAEVFLLLFAKLAFFILNYIAADGQYGIFSDDSRIDFLNLSPTLSKTRYLDWIIDIVLLMSIGLNCIAVKGVRPRDLLFLALIVGFGFLTGSKGGTFLSMAYAALFVYAAFPNAFSFMSKKFIFGVLGFFVLVILGYVYSLSATHDVDFGDQVSLSLYRFILSADARIMAYDPEVTKYVLDQSNGGLLAELFRGPAKILGFPVAEFSIGVYQYQFEVGSTSFLGSTNQLTAMFATYGGAWAPVAFLIVAGVMWCMSRFLGAAMNSRTPGVGWVAAASLYLLSSTLCQGFDAFVQLVPIALLAVLALEALRPLRRGRRRPARWRRMPSKAIAG